MSTSFLTAWIFASLFRILFSECYSLYASRVECSDQAADLGMTHIGTTWDTPETCASVVSQSPECGDYFMFSWSGRSSDCRCCSPNGGEIGGNPNSHWEIYQIHGQCPANGTALHMHPIPTGSVSVEFIVGISVAAAIFILLLIGACWWTRRNRIRDRIPINERFQNRYGSFEDDRGQKNFKNSLFS